MHIFFKFVVFYLLGPFIIYYFPFSSPFMEFGIQITLGSVWQPDPCRSCFTNPSGSRFLSFDSRVESHAAIFSYSPRLQQIHENRGFADPMEDGVF